MRVLNQKQHGPEDRRAFDLVTEPASGSEAFAVDDDRGQLETTDREAYVAEGKAAVVQARLVAKATASATSRGAGGFGSTGVKSAEARGRPNKKKTPARRAR